MKRTVVLFAFVLLGGVAGFANSSSDPRIIIKDPVCETCRPVGTHFSFTSPQSGSGTLFFLNNSGVSWFNLELLESPVPANAITCATDNVFMHCTVSTVGGITTILASGVGGIFTGIPAGRNFSFTFQNWPGGVNFSAVANVPEPVSLVLFVTGLGAIVTRRRKLLRQF